MSEPQANIGKRRANQLLMAALALQAVIFLAVSLLPPKEDPWAIVGALLGWLAGGVLTLVLLLIAAIVVHVRLDRSDRSSFWATLLACIAFLALLWFGACGGLNVIYGE